MILSRRLLFVACLLGAASLHADDALAVPNGGFESGRDGWTASPDDTAGAISQVSPEAAHSGQVGLRVKQPTGGPGSWMQGTKIAVEGGKSYRLTYWARCVEDSGIGIWVQVYDAQGKPIATPNQSAFISLVPQVARDWAEYHIDLTLPDGTAFLTPTVHAFSKRSCVADFDDFTLTPIATPAPSAAPAVAPAKAPTAAQLPPPDPARVKEIAAALDPTPRGVGPAFSDRKTWEAVAADADFKAKTVARAERFLGEPIPDVAALYAESSKTGDRKDAPLIDRRRLRMASFVLAEGMENQGRFLPAIEKEILAICSETSWISSGHVKFTTANDLGTAMTSWNLATAVAMLGDRLPEATRKVVQETVRQRVFGPYLEEIRGKRASEWWANNPNNWNAVVHGGIVGAALALDESVDERAEIVAAAEQETQHYIKGFPEDGYSLEGMGYWKYGFGHYVLLSEAVLAATHGKISFYSRDNIRLVAQFPRRFEMIPGVWPAYSDALFMEEASPWLFNIIDHRYGLGDETARSISLDGMFSTFLYAWGINLSFDPSAPPLVAEGGNVAKGRRLRDWFEQSQILVSRQAAGQAGLSFSMKGGNNGTSHGHDDQGSFVVVLAKQPLLVDPGSVAYNAQSFGPQRYQNTVLNSYGHSVPKVAGQLQKEGANRASTVVAKEFSDAADSVTLDLSKAYEVPTLKTLMRRFDYVRADGGSLTVTDQAEFASPQDFGTALMTYGEAVEEKPGVWTISRDGETVRVEISAGGLPFTVKNEVLKDESRVGKVHRLGIDLQGAAGQAAIVMKITVAGK